MGHLIIQADAAEVGRIRHDKNSGGTPTAFRRILDLKEGPGVTLTDVDNPGLDRIERTISSSVTSGVFLGSSSIPAATQLNAFVNGPLVLNDGLVTVPGGTVTSFIVIHYEAEWEHIGPNLVGHGDRSQLTLEIANPGVFTDIEASYGGYHLKRITSFTASNGQLSVGGSMSRTLILSTTKPAGSGLFDPAQDVNIRWGQIQRLVGNNVGLRTEDRKIEVWGQ